MIRFEEILDKVAAYNSQTDEDLLRRAYVFSAREHKGQVRRSGEPYLVHPLNVASILADLKADDVAIVVGLLHDVLEDTLTTKEAIAKQFGAEVADLVDGLTKISKFSYVSREEEQAETFRKMILAMVSDIRVVLVKLADRLHNMRTLQYLPEGKRFEIARETMDIYAPIANRLGMGLVKGELEDLAFLHLEPAEHERVRREVERNLKGSEKTIEQIRVELETRLREAGVAGEVVGRRKHYHSIWSKMQRRGVDLAQLYDILAFRIVVGETRDCYAALGLVHQRWRPVPGRIKDYIAMPKPNFYQSLHTSVMSDKAQPFEVQIRTREMDLIAERGIAAHWKYKEGRLAPQQNDVRLQWLRQLVDWQSDVSDPRQFLSSLKADLSADEVYTFTPKGEVFAFPRGATTVDFAYRVHTDVGHRCVGARINGRLVPLKTNIASGDIVEILTAPHQAPSRDWLSFVATSRARHKIRQYIHTQEKLQAVELGRRLLERELEEIQEDAQEARRRRQAFRRALPVGLLQARGPVRGDRLRQARGQERARALRPRRGARQARGCPPGDRGLPGRAQDPALWIARHRRSGTQRFARFPGEVLHPGSRRKDPRLHHPGTRRFRAFGELPQRAQPAVRPGALDRRRLGRREKYVLRDRARSRLG